MTRIASTGPLAKPATLHSRKLMDFAREQTCTLRIPGVCNNDPATTVAAHVPGPLKSQNSKVADWFCVHACSACHDCLDGRWRSSVWDDGQKVKMIIRAIYETQSRLFDAELLQVAE
jgi:hypothetical protein